MPSIRLMFHEIGNWHNKITVGAGVAKAILKKEPENKLGAQLKKEMLARLDELEKHAIGADKALNALKDIIYAKVDPDTGKAK